MGRKWAFGRELRVKFWIRVALMMAVVSITPLILAGVQAVRISTDKAAVKAAESIRRDVETLATYVERWTFNQAETLTGWFEVWSPLALTDPKTQQALMRAVYKAMRSSVTVVLVDKDGDPVHPPLYVTRDQRHDAGLVDRVWGSPERAARFVDEQRKVERASSGVRLGNPYLADGARFPSVALVASRAGLDLALAVEISMIDVAWLFTESPQRGVALFGPTKEAVLGGEHPLIDQQRLEPLLGTNADLEDVMGGTEVVGSIAVTTSTNWSVAVVEPSAVAEVAGAEIREQVNRLVFLSVILVFVVGFSVRVQLSTPIERLRDFANAVADGDYGRRMGVERRDELGDLARAFNHMSERLEHNRTEIDAQRSEIEAFNQELQDRVEERTRELSEAQEHLVASGQLAAIAEVGAGLAHDLNNPLAGILGLSQLLKQRHAETADGRLLGQIEEQALRCREVVDAMVRFAGGEVDPRSAPVIDLRATLEEVLGLVRGPFRQRGVALECEMPAGPLRARLDPVLATRVLVQVLNALRAGLGEGAELQITSERTTETVAIVLTPDRPVALGTSADDWRASGMALWVARQLLDQVGGALVERNDASNEWVVRLPAAHNSVV